jgi:alpha-ketoglutarate-dependent taurine dioxygenase
MPAGARSIAEFENGDRWPIETDAVISVLGSHFGADVRGEQMNPPADAATAATLRAALREGAPQLAALTDEVRRNFDAEGACGIVVSRLGLSVLDVDDQRKVIYALSVLLGDVVWTHPVDNRVIWDVTNKETDQPAPGVEKTGPKYSSFSENDREAEYHTDASFSEVPDRYFLLYSVQAAECGGGQTFLTDGRVLADELAASQPGRAALRVLRDTKFPMRVPKAFRQRARVAEDGHSYEPVIGEGPVWRFRKDKIENGLAKYPDYATDEVRSALDTLYRQMETRTDEYRAAIPTDAVLIVDNHLALHGRTGFTDPRRHLLRARFDKPVS